MGAGGSAAATAAATVEDAVVDVVEEADTRGGLVAERAETAASTAGTIADEAVDGATLAGSVAVGAAVGASAASRIVTSVPEEARETVQKLVGEVGPLLTNEQLEIAVAVVAKSTLNGVEAVAAAVGAALGQAADMAPEVVAVLGPALCAIGAHLGPLGLAAGLLGSIIHTFNLSKDQDKNVQTVLVWSTSVADWLLLIAGRIGDSKTTLPLFEALKTQLEVLHGMIAKQQQRWRASKMLATGSFEREFRIAKEGVLELKNALYDFLDQETQDSQERHLKVIEAAQLDVTAKLATMDDQLTEIRHLLKEQSSTTREELAEEEAIYENMQRMASTTTSVKFKEFVQAFECLFFDGFDLLPEVRRGLKIAIDRSNAGVVTKQDWIKFYKQWTHSTLPMENYIRKLADEAPPTLYALANTNAKGTAAKASSMAASGLGAVGAKAETLGYSTVASSAKGAASGLSSFGDKLKKKATAPTNVVKA